MEFLGIVAGVWVAWRWLGFVVGLGRLRWFGGRAKREARRAVINRGALNVFFSIGVVYVWAFALELRLEETFVGFLAATMMISLAIGIAAAFMQPEERTPQTLDICRLVGWRRPSGARQGG